MVECLGIGNGVIQLFWVFAGPAAGIEGTDAMRWSGVCHPLQKGGKVAILMEHVGPSITTIEHVITQRGLCPAIQVDLTE